MCLLHSSNGHNLYDYALECSVTIFNTIATEQYVVLGGRKVETSGTCVQYLSMYCIITTYYKTSPPAT